MKQHFTLLLCATFFIFSSYAQPIVASKVPPTIKRALKSKHTAAKYIEWEKEGDDFVAYFTVREDWAKAYFSKSGKWLRSETNLGPKSIPSTIKKTLMTKYKGFTASDVVKMEWPKKTMYYIQIDKDLESYKLEMKSDGTVVKETKIEYEIEEYVEEEEVPDE